MGVSHRADGVGPGHRRVHRATPSVPAAPVPAPGDVGELEEVAGLFQTGAQAGEPWFGLGEFGQQVDEDPEVVPEVLEIGVAT